MRRGVIGLINGNSIKDFKTEDDDILFLEMKETLSVSLVTDCIFMVRSESERIFHMLPKGNHARYTKQPDL
jgi:hypothetical protein